MDVEARISLAVGCPDLLHLKPVEGAGEVFDLAGRRVQRLQFGGIVGADSYYGAWMTELIRQCRGAHEPQEERVFAEVLDYLPAAPTMIELGGYWCFYSIWFAQRFPGGAAACCGANFSSANCRGGKSGAEQYRNADLEICHWIAARRNSRIPDRG